MDKDTREQQVFYSLSFFIQGECGASVNLKYGPAAFGGFFWKRNRFTQRVWKYLHKIVLNALNMGHGWKLLFFLLESSLNKVLV